MSNANNCYYYLYHFTLLPQIYIIEIFIDFIIFLAVDENFSIFFSFKKKIKNWLVNFIFFQNVCLYPFIFDPHHLWNLLFNVCATVVFGRIFLSFEAGISDAISSFKCKKYFSFWNMYISQTDLFD